MPRAWKSHLEGLHWPKLIAGLLVVFAAFQWTASLLGSDRGQAGLLDRPARRRGHSRRRAAFLPAIIHGSSPRPRTRIPRSSWTPHSSSAPPSSGWQLARQSRFWSFLCRVGLCLVKHERDQVFWAAVRVETSGFVREGRLERYSIHPNVSPEPRPCFMYALWR